MKSDFFAIYDLLQAALPDSPGISALHSCSRWAMAETESGAGLAMAMAMPGRPPLFPQGMCGMGVRQVGQALKSWNFGEAALALAACNAVYNTPQRLSALGCYLPFEKYYTEGLDFTGKTVGIIGHMSGPPGMREAAKAVYILEREPQEGDYPDSACDYILPLCDIVLITGSTLINKTLPHILELSQNAYTVLTGPSVPMCPELMSFGVDRLAGLVIDRVPAMRTHVLQNMRGSPYPYGLPFMLERR